MPITTENQARALAVMLNEIRPDWPWNQTLKTLHKNRQCPAPYADIVTASITKAQQPDTRTPAAIFLPGNHWPPETRKTLPQPDPCQDHPTLPGHNCPGCRADVLTGLRPKEAIGKHWNIHDTLNTAMDPQ